MSDLTTNLTNHLKPMQSWSKLDEETLETVLAITPDLKPCELAVICQKPCREVSSTSTRSETHVSSLQRFISVVNTAPHIASIPYRSQPNQPIC